MPQESTLLKCLSYSDSDEVFTNLVTRLGLMSTTEAFTRNKKLLKILYKRFMRQNQDLIDKKSIL
jgi:hypothetical protein